MIPAVIQFVSPKGYGIAKTNDEKLIFVPARLMGGYSSNDTVEIETEPGEVKNLRAVNMVKYVQAEIPQRIAGDSA